MSMYRDERALRLFGQAIRKMRQARGWTQADLAEKASIHRTYVGDIERGARNVALLNVLRLAEALGVGADELLRGIRIARPSSKRASGKGR